MIELDDVATQIQLTRRSLVDTSTAERLLADTDAEGLVLIVGDRVTDDARRKILSARAGYLDLRGNLGLGAPGIVINADVPPIKQERDRQDALAGSAGLEVAARLLLSPNNPAAVRAVAREIGRSPSTVSSILGALRRDGLIDSGNAVADTTLFWRLSERWPRRRTFVAAVPAGTDQVMVRALRLGLNDVDAPGWALTDTAAAAAYCAPVAFRADQQRSGDASTWAGEAIGRSLIRCSSHSTSRRTRAAGARSLTLGPRTRGGRVSGSRVTFVGDAMAAVIQGVVEVRDLIGETPVIVGGMAVLSRLSNPHRATSPGDLDLIAELLAAAAHRD